MVLLDKFPKFYVLTSIKNKIAKLVLWCKREFHTCIDHVTARFAIVRSTSELVEHLFYNSNF